MEVNNCKVRFQLDSGADVNTICQKYVKRAQVSKTTQKLIMWNKTKCVPLGEARLEVINPRTNQTAKVTFAVVQNNFNCLLGLETVREMELITVNDDKFINKINTSSDLGDLGETHLYIDPEVKPRTLPSRRIPLALHDQVKSEIEVLQQRGILVPVERPTEWVSQMTVVRKPNGKLRICIDPQPLNVALKREHYKMPTLDDILPKLNKARIFTKLDVKEAFWHVRLNEESSYLTTMIIPFGRYRWTRLPFGLKVSSKIFQKLLNDSLCDLDGVICVADDILVIGCGNDDAAAELDHAKKLIALHKRCSERNIKLNDDKAVIKKRKITFMGHCISDQGIKPDKTKVKAIANMPQPVDVQGVRRFCGMLQYLSKFIPHLVDTLEPIRMLTRKDVIYGTSFIYDMELVKIL